MKTLLAVLCLVGYSTASQKGGMEKDSVPMRVDCHPAPLATEEKCKAIGCLWVPATTPNEPWCFFDNAAPPGYDVQSISNSSGTIHAVLLRRNTPSLFGGDAGILNLVVSYESDTQLRILLRNPYGSVEERYVSEKFRETLPPKKKAQGQESGFESAKYSVIIQHSPFGIAVVRKSTKVVIFDTRNIPGFVFAERFLSISTRTPTSNVYGFGEQTHPNLKHDMSWKKWSAFARDQPVTAIDYMNLYGTHPFYMCVEKNGEAHGVVLMNSHAQHVELAPYPSITYRTIGGDLDFTIFMGPTPELVNQQYVQSIGLPMMPPYWSLGFHLCRYGYAGTENVKTVFERNRAAGIPYDTQWVDIDYMDDQKDFTYDHTKFAGLPALADTIHSSDMHFIVILDPAIASRDSNYAPLTTGIKQGVYIQTANNTNLEGKVWPGFTYFPDFTNPTCQSWWAQMVADWHKLVQVDGLWIDMNEPSNFVSGSVKGCQNNNYNKPPFVPVPDQYLPSKTLCMDSKQYWGKHFSVHSMYGYSEAIATNKALKALFPGKRPFVLSRSTYLGSGSYTAHWTGDNVASWEQLKWSIITILEFQMFGIPFTGADICGFLGSTNPELCLRWMQLGSFYPFMRNHNTLGAKPQDPAYFDSTTVDGMKSAMLIRYKLLPTLYTLFHQAHISGSPVAKPLFYEWSSDKMALSVDDQFMWGSLFMIVPIIIKGSTSRTAYFPAGRWFNYYTGDEISGAAKGRSITLSIPLSSIGLFVRGGHILPWQAPAVTTTQSRANNFGLIVGLDGSESATGSLFWDDGVTEDTYINGQYLQLLFNASLSASKTSGTLTITRSVNGYRGSDSLKLTDIQVLGLKGQPIRVTLNGNQLPVSSVNFGTKKVLTLSTLTIPVSSGSSSTQTIEWFFS